jgi:thioesterase domain-containing protein
LSLNALFQYPTIEQFASRLNQSTDVFSQSPLVEIQQADSRQPFFCIHPGGGNVLCFYELARYFGGEQSFYGIQAPGLNGERAPYTRIEDMASYYIELIRTVQSEGSYLLGGFCSGGIVAFEMARQLYQQEQPVALLALLDSLPYSDADKSRFAGNSANVLLEFFRENLGGTVTQDLSLSHEYLQQLEEKQQFDYVLSQIRQSALLPQNVGPLQIRRIFEVYKANVHAMISYIPKVYFGRITLFLAGEEQSIPPYDPVQVWSRLSPQAIKGYSVPGSHFTMLSQPHVQVLAKQLKTCIARAIKNFKNDDR